MCSVANHILVEGGAVDFETSSGFDSTTLVHAPVLPGAVAGVSSVNGKAGAVTLTATDVGAVDDSVVVPDFVLLIENGLI